ncbi:MAG TPA: hydroxyacylglutathione hydrolase [Candidatus Polarisedimenticolia bacterium]|nr:hydroxyacylglutathione hydrolase [Candidatus Polarisedimenticolia bacterium]
MSLEIIPVPVLNDNYVWLMHDAVLNETVVIDPAVAEPVLAEAEARGWRITQIWNTHWHPDHIGGNAAIKAATGCTVTGPAAEAAKIDTLDVAVGEGDIATLGGRRAEVWEVGAHTAGHIAYYMASAGVIFVGDTMFAMGCGRLFEGTAAQMFANMQRFATLPDETAVYCAHEYTLSNARYAIVAEPDNAAIAERLVEVQAARALGEATVPTTIGEERATNPFMRARDVAELARRRTEKDNF